MSLGQEYSRSSSLDEAQLCEWLGSSTPGDKLCYYRGALAVDCDPDASRLNAKDRREVRRVAKRALMAVENGFVHLIQRRNGPGDFTYMLIARRRPNPTRISIPGTLTTSPTIPPSSEP